MTLPESTTDKKVAIIPQASRIVVNRREKVVLQLRVLWQVFQVSLQQTGNPLTAIQMIWRIREKYQTIFGEPLMTKIAKVDGRFFWRLGAAGFPSPASVRMHQNEVSRFMPGTSPYGLRTLLFAITKKCALNCEHCFEWEHLNQQEVLSTADLIEIVRKYQAYGTTQIMLSGGEPMLRVNDIYKVLEAALGGTDFWIITSGVGLTAERAKRLKQLGLTGVMVSLDHFDASRHNAFRGFENAYDSAVQAVVNANQAGLVTTLSLCATKTFTTAENLARYMELAKTLGVSFVQILEPRASGRYQDQDVELGEKELLLLEKMYADYNTSSAFQDFPIVNYLGYHQRKVGCFGAGNRFFYIDTDGDAQICPFCTNKVANALQFTAEDMVSLLGQFGCHGFKQGQL